MIYLHFGFTLQQQSKDSDHGECPTTAGTICTQRRGHWASSIRVKQPFVSFQLSNLERMPAALFWLSVLTNKLRLLPREALSPGKFILTKNVRLKGEGQAKSFLKDISTGDCHHYWQNPKAIASASICSVSSSPTVIYSS